MKNNEICGKLRKGANFAAAAKSIKMHVGCNFLSEGYSIPMVFPAKGIH